MWPHIGYTSDQFLAISKKTNQVLPHIVHMTKILEISKKTGQMWPHNGYTYDQISLIIDHIITKTYEASSIKNH